MAVLVATTAGILAPEIDTALCICAPAGVNPTEVKAEPIVVTVFGLGPNSPPPDNKGAVVVVLKATTAGLLAKEGPVILALPAGEGVASEIVCAVVLTRPTGLGVLHAGKVDGTGTVAEDGVEDLLPWVQDDAAFGVLSSGVLTAEELTAGSPAVETLPVAGDGDRAGDTAPGGLTAEVKLLTAPPPGVVVRPLDFANDDGVTPVVLITTGLC